MKRNKFEIKRLVSLVLILIMLISMAPGALAESFSALVTSGSMAVYGDAGLSQHLGSLNKNTVVVVSGYSGGDIVASQVVSALNMNKGFWLPAEFCLLETANDAGTAITLSGIDERLSKFTVNILRQLID